MDKILTLLNQADQNRNTGELDAAEHAYRQALKMAEADEQHDLADQAAEGLSLLQVARLNTKFHPNTIDFPWDKYNNAVNEHSALAYIHPFIDKEIELAQGSTSSTPASLYTKHLRSVQQRIIRAIKGNVAEATRLIKSYTTNPENRPLERAEIERLLTNTLKMCEAKHLEFPTDVEPVTVTTIITDLINHPEIDHLQKQAQHLHTELTSIPPDHAPDVQTPLFTTAPSIHSDENAMIINDNEEIIIETADQRAISALNQVDIVLQRHTDKHFKDASKILEGALNISGLSDEIYQRLNTRLLEIKSQREKFLERFGQLTTARQLNDAEEELLVTLSFIQNGETIDHDGGDLVVRFAEVSTNFYNTLVKTAQDLMGRSDQLQISGRDLLDEKPLETSQKHIQQAIALLQGAEIGKKQSGSISAERQAAIEQLRTTINEKSSQDSLIQDLKNTAQKLEEDLVLVKRIKPIYDQALAAYTKRDYQQAWEQASQLQSLITKDFSSQQVETIISRSHTARENELLAQLKIIQYDIQTFSAQHQFGQIDEIVKKLYLLDPQFQSTKIDALQNEIKLDLKKVDELKQYISEQLNTAQEALDKIPPQLDIAQTIVTSLLRINPHNTEAQKLLDQVLVHKIKETHSNIVRIIESPSTSSEQILAEKQTALNLDVSINQITNQEIKQNVTQKNISLIKQIEQAGEKREKQEALDKTLKEAIKSVEDSIQSGAFETAESHIKVVRTILPAHDPRLTKLETLLRNEWGDALHRQVNHYLTNDPEQPQEALKALDEIKRLGYHTPKTAELYHKAQLISLRSEATTAIDRGEFARVIQLLETTEMTDPSITDLLKLARHLEAERLYKDGKWSELLKLLEKIGALNEEQLYWQRVATFEVTIKRAQDELRNKAFDACEVSLNKARDLTKHIASTDDRVSKLSQDLQNARTLYHRIDVLTQQALTHKQNYTTNNNLEELLKAIEALKKALDDKELQPDDIQRQEVHKLHNEFTNTYSTAIAEQRKKLLNEANNALQNDDIATALNKFRKVLQLVPNGKDSEAQEGIERCLHRLKELRNKQVEEVENQLNLKGKGQLAILPQTINELKQKTEMLRNIASDINHEGLNRSLSYLDEAEHLLVQAETILNTIRARWATLRSNAINQDELDHHEIDNNIQQGIILFDKKTYIHTYLDHTRTESISKRINDDLNDLKNAQKHYKSLQFALASSQRNHQEILSSFEQLQAIEERLYKTTLRLIDEDHVTSLNKPISQAERYPRQAKILQVLRDEIEQAKREEKSIRDLSSLRVNISQRQRNEELLKRLAPQEQLSHTNIINGDQVEQWEHTLTTGKKYLADAQQSEEQAREYDQKKSLPSALTHYKSAVNSYEQAITHLEPLTNIKLDYIAIELLVRNALEALTTAQTKLKIIKEENLINSCNQRINQAQEFITQAHQALNNRELEDARDKANQAYAINSTPDIHQQVQEILNAYETELTSTNSPVGAIVTTLVILGLIILAIMFGPALWAWISEFLFPVS